MFYKENNNGVIFAFSFQLVSDWVRQLQPTKGNYMSSNLLKKMLVGTTVIFSTVMYSTTAIAGPIMHVHDGSGTLGTVDVVTGDVNVIGSMGVIMTDIAFSPTGDLYGLSFGSLYSINALTAQVTFIGGHGIDGGNALVFGADGTLYGAGASSNNLYTLNTTTGASSSLGNMGFASAGDLAFNSGDLYLASTTNQLVKVDLSDLSSTFAVGNFGVSGVFGFATGADDNLYAVAGTTAYTVNLSTGALFNGVSFGGQGLSGAFGQSFYTEAGAEPEPTDVPEPDLLILMGLAIASVGITQRLKSARR